MVRITLRNIFVIIFLLPFLCRSNLPPGEKVQQVMSFTRQVEFDFIEWTLNAIWIKGQQASVMLPRYMSDEQQSQFILDYLQGIKQIELLDAQIEMIYSDPSIANPGNVAAGLLAQIEQLQNIRRETAPIGESIIQYQVSTVLNETNLAWGGQAFPPLLYHVTPLPMMLIVSPRDVIRQDVSVSLLSDMTLADISALESQVEQSLDVSALVVSIGGISTYPTMVMDTSNFPWLIEAVVHEWTHNYLVLRPLGINYDTSPELRTMNETTANIVGKEISQLVLARYYPQLFPQAPPAAESQEQKSAEEKESPLAFPVFDFRREMHTTRITVDHMLAQGKVEEAEAYMEKRRQFIWKNGYQIRRLNQAYFAFHGAYADVPGGAAGNDPVGPAVRALREKSPSLAGFLNQISSMKSYEMLEQALAVP